MRKTHDYEALLKYMRMLEDGFPIDYIHNKFGIGAERLKCLWLQYQKQGISALHRKSYTQPGGELKQQIVSDIEKNHLTLVQASLKYGVSATRLSVWLKIARGQGLDALLITKKRGRPPGMVRPLRISSIVSLRHHDRMRSGQPMLRSLRWLTERHIYRQL